MPAKERRAIIDKLSQVKVGDGVLVVGTTPFTSEGLDAHTPPLCEGAWRPLG